MNVMIDVGWTQDEEKTNQIGESKTIPFNAYLNG